MLLVSASTASYLELFVYAFLIANYNPPPPRARPSISRVPGRPERIEMLVLVAVSLLTGTLCLPCFRVGWS